MSLDRRSMERALPGYEIGAEIGRGAFGLVYAGEHRTLGRRVAIKQLPRAFGADPAASARFRNEARLVASLEHPHIVPVYDYVEQDGLRLLVMEYLPDGTLVQGLGDPAVQPRSVEWKCAVAVAVGLALHHAHGHGVLHRDVKPENVLFSGATPKLADFGIAKDSTSDSGLTQLGTVLGTVPYMSPEQANGEMLGPPSDVYSLAIVLYEMLAERLPFPHVESLTELLQQRRTQDVIGLLESTPAVPGPIAGVVSAALARHPGERTSDAARFVVDIDAACREVLGSRWLRNSGLHVVGLDAVVAALRPDTVVFKPPSESVPDPAPLPVVARAPDTVRYVGPFPAENASIRSVPLAEIAAFKTVVTAPSRGRRAVFAFLVVAAVAAVVVVILLAVR